MGIVLEGELIRCVGSDKTNIFHEHSTIHTFQKNGRLTVRYIDGGNIAPSSLLATSFTRREKTHFLHFHPQSIVTGTNDRLKATQEAAVRSHHV